MQTNRLSSSEFGSAIDRSKLVRFTFDGCQLTGFNGDTVASALLANDIHLVARSIKLHRPRGILSCGVEEPSALVECKELGKSAIPNLKATEVLLSEGLIVRSQNNWPSRNFDAFATIAIGSRFLQAGFFYKTFIWPRWGWHRVYEKAIRNFAGAGRLRVEETESFTDSSDSDLRHKHAEILIVGGGPAGLNAALICARQGVSAVLVEQEPKLGGSLLWSKKSIGQTPSDQWLSDTLSELSLSPNVALLSRTLAFGQYDHGLILAYQSGPHSDCGIFWKIRANQILLATGAVERPLVFPNNDRPGIMLAGALRKYLHHYAVRPGKRAFVAVINEGERDALIADCTAAGIEVAGCLEPGEQIIDTKGRGRVSSVKIKTADNRIVHHRCDLICVSGGWTPTAHLAAHVHGSLPVDDAKGVPVAPEQGGRLLAMGACRGILDLKSVLQDSESQAHNALSLNGRFTDRIDDQDIHFEQMPNESMRSQPKSHRAFVDLQNDVTRADLIQTIDEGYRDIELVKRYTATGMGTDQGKTSWVNAIREVAAATGNNPTALGHTTYRPPYSPIPLAGIAGARVARHMTPIRRTPTHRIYENLGCQFQNSGDWLYSRYFPKSSETLQQAVNREVRAVRTGVGIVDMSTLGKFEIKGEDAEKFISRIYCNNVSDMPIGKVRYGLMLREDGIVFDDGTVARLGERHFVLTATTANSASVWRWITRLAQVQWPDLEVTLTKVSEHWASIAIAGPLSREVLAMLKLNIDTDVEKFPFASVREGQIQDSVPCRVHSVSYSGELCFEVSIPAGYACSFVEQLLVVGQDVGITPYGLEALDVLRIEKGHLSVGREIDGRTTPFDLGLGKKVSSGKDFIGRSLLDRPGLRRDDRMQLVGMTAVNDKSEIPAGAVIASSSHQNRVKQDVIGWLTAATCSPTLDRSIALALLQSGHHRQNEKLWAVSPVSGESTQVVVGPTCFYDVKGQRLNG